MIFLSKLCWDWFRKKQVYLGLQEGFKFENV